MKGIDDDNALSRNGRERVSVAPVRCFYIKTVMCDVSDLAAVISSRNSNVAYQTNLETHYFCEARTVTIRN